MKRISSLCIGIVCSTCLIAWSPTNAFIGEDLGLDIYKSLDEGVRELRQVQYEYELSDQGDGSVFETVNQILEREGLECQIHSSADIERLIGNSGGDVIGAIMQACAGGEERVPLQFAEKIQNALRDIQRVFLERADKKAEMTYAVARIGLYADGNTENSPFDLIVDLQEIDKIIFGEEIEYNGVTPVNNQSFQNFINNIINEPIEGVDDEEEETGVEEETPEEGIEDEDIDEEDIVDDPTPIPEHGGVCLPPNNSGLDDDIVIRIRDNLNPIRGGEYTPIINTFLYPEGIRDDWGNWQGPFKAEGPDENFNSTKAPWAGNEFFCIIIEFETTNYGLIGGETRSIMKVLSKVAEHCEKPANASLTQRKQTTNNFEIASIIKDLPSKLRGLGIEVSSKPIPILEETEQDEDPTREEVKEEVENMLRERYKALGLDYDRQNDIEITDRSPIVQKIFQTSVGMPATYPEQRLNEYRSYDRAFIRAAQETQNDTTNITTQRQLDGFVSHFNELERFTFSLADYIEQFTGVITTLERKPTRTP
ncbi:hypothetical protein LAT59_01890 [Candidatus Gracilibacteria bacterium]|nr:hypothetical protein [Candidatus Gracilibacteria bacterium]